MKFSIYLKITACPLRSGARQDYLLLPFVQYVAASSSYCQQLRKGNKMYTDQKERKLSFFADDFLCRKSQVINNKKPRTKSCVQQGYRLQNECLKTSCTSIYYQYISFTSFLPILTGSYGRKHGGGYHRGRNAILDRIIGEGLLFKIEV